MDRLATAKRSINEEVDSIFILYNSIEALFRLTEDYDAVPVVSVVRL